MAMDESRSGAGYYKSLQMYRKKAEKAALKSQEGTLEPIPAPHTKKGLMSFRDKMEAGKQEPKDNKQEQSDKFIVDWFVMMRKLREDNLEEQDV